MNDVRNLDMFDCLKVFLSGAIAYKLTQFGILVTFIILLFVFGIIKDRLDK